MLGASGGIGAAEVHFLPSVSARAFLDDGRFAEFKLAFLFHQHALEAWEKYGKEFAVHSHLLSRKFDRDLHRAALEVRLAAAIGGGARALSPKGSASQEPTELEDFVHELAGPPIGGAPSPQHSLLYLRGAAATVAAGTVGLLHRLWDSASNSADWLLMQTPWGLRQAGIESNIQTESLVSAVHAAQQYNLQQAAGVELSTKNVPDSGYIIDDGRLCISPVGLSAPVEQRVQQLNKEMAAAAVALAVVGVAMVESTKADSLLLAAAEQAMRGEMDLRLDNGAMAEMMLEHNGFAYLLSPKDGNEESTGPKFTKFELTMEKGRASVPTQAGPLGKGLILVGDLSGARDMDGVMNTTATDDSGATVSEAQPIRIQTLMAAVDDVCKLL